MKSDLTAMPDWSRLEERIAQTYRIGNLYDPAERYHSMRYSSHNRNSYIEPMLDFRNMTPKELISHLEQYVEGHRYTARGPNDVSLEFELILSTRNMLRAVKDLAGQAYDILATAYVDVEDETIERKIDEVSKKLEGFM